MTLWDVLLVSEDLDFPSDEAVGDTFSAVYVCAFHDYAVLDLGVSDCAVVSDAGVGVDVGVRADGAAVADDGWPSGCRPAVDDRPPSY